MSLIPSNIQALAAMAGLAGQSRARDAKTRPAKETLAARRKDLVDLTVVNVEHENAVRNLKDNLQEDTKEDREANPQAVVKQGADRPKIDLSA